MSEISRISGEELLRRELERLRDQASGAGLVEHTTPTPPAATGPTPTQRLGPASPSGGLGFVNSWLTVALVLVAGVFLFRLTTWLFDFPTGMLDARSDAVMSAGQFQLLLVLLAVLVALVVFANVIVGVWATFGSPSPMIRKALGCCGVLAAALVAYPWDATFWLHPRAPRFTGPIIVSVIVWELLSPYVLGWSEKLDVDWLDTGSGSGEHLLRLISCGLAGFAVLAGLALAIRGESGRRRTWHVLLGVPALSAGTLLLMPWARLLWADPAPQQNQLVGWALSGALFVTMGVLLLAHDQEGDQA